MQIAFAVSALCCVVAAIVSWFRGAPVIARDIATETARPISEPRRERVTALQPAAGVNPFYALLPRRARPTSSRRRVEDVRPNDRRRRFTLRRRSSITSFSTLAVWLLGNWSFDASAKPTGQGLPQIVALPLSQQPAENGSVESFRKQMGEAGSGQPPAGPSPVQLPSTTHLPPDKQVGWLSCTLTPTKQKRSPPQH